MERDDYRCRDHEVEPKKKPKKKKKSERGESGWWVGRGVPKKLKFHRSL